MTPDQARKFVASNHRAVLITRRSTGGLQTSPVTVGIVNDAKVVISSRQTAYKLCNLRRHPAWSGPGGSHGPRREPPASVPSGFQSMVWG